MNTLLVAINSKYIHSNLAVYSISAYAKSKGFDINLSEYTINQPIETIIKDIYRQKPDLLGFSCYIWNIEYVTKIIPELRKLLPNCHICLGGPEVSYDTSHTFKSIPDVDTIIMGEGEIVFSTLINHLENNTDPYTLKGLAINSPRIVNTPSDYIDMNQLPFPYSDISLMENRIIYYESSRGCPYNCSYCLSCVDKRVRYRDINLVKKELKFFIDAKVPQVKFVDRTFNCNRERTMAIWQFINENDNKITNFHFEISADILSDDEISLLGQMRPGLVQLEIGVQTTNYDTLNAIHRKTDYVKLSNVVNKVHSLGTVHQHLDLIAGLPFEDYTSFANSFNEVYALKPEQLQLGFLKVLKGSHMWQTAKEMNILYTNYPPYEVISTPWLSYEDILKLKGIEEMVELYYNSSQFNATISLISHLFDTPFAMYEYLSNYYEKQGLMDIGHSRLKRYEVLLDAIKVLDNITKEDIFLLRETLCYDLYLRENLKNRPAFLNDETEYKKRIHSLYLDEERIRSVLPSYKDYTTKQIERMTNTEHFALNINHLIKTGEIILKDNYVLFDYLCIDPVHNCVRTIDVSDVII